MPAPARILLSCALAVVAAAAACKARQPRTRVLEGDGAATAAAFAYPNDYEALSNAEKIFKDVKEQALVAVRRSANDTQAFEPFVKLDALLAAQQAAVGTALETPYTRNIMRHIASRYVQLRYEMGFADTAAVATAYLGKYFAGCTDYASCGQAISRLAAVVSYVPEAVLAALNGGVATPSFNKANIDPVVLLQPDKFPLLKDLAARDKTPKLTEMLEFQYISLRATAEFYKNTGVGDKNQIGDPPRLPAVAVDNLVRMLAALSELTYRRWIGPLDPNGVGASKVAGSGLQQAVLGEFEALAESDEANLKAATGLDVKDVRAALEMTVNDMVSALFRVIQGNIGLELYSRRYILPGIKPWVAMMADVDPETAIYTYMRFTAYEMALPGRADFALGLEDQVARSANAKRRDGTYGKRDDFAAGQNYADLLLVKSDAEAAVFLKGVGLEDADESGYVDCARKNPESMGGSSGVKLPMMLRCESDLAERAPGFKSLASLGQRYAGALERFSLAQKKVEAADQKKMQSGVVRRNLNAMLDEFSSEESLENISLQSTMHEFSTQELTRKCYHMAIRRQPLPAVVSLFGKTIDLKAACLRDAADLRALAAGTGPLPNFERNVSNFLTDKFVAECEDQIRSLIRERTIDGLIAMPVIGWAAGGTVKILGKAFTTVAFRAAIDAYRLTRVSATVIAKVSEAAMFSVYQKIFSFGSAVILGGKGVDEASKTVWNSDKGFWDNFGESLATGTALFFYQPFVGKVFKPNENIGRLVGTRSSQEFKDAVFRGNGMVGNAKGLARQTLYGTLAIAADNMVFASANTFFSLAEAVVDDTSGQGIDPVDVAKAFALDFVKTLPMTMIFRVSHGVGGYWTNGPTAIDIRMRGATLLQVERAMNEAAKGSRDLPGISGTDRAQIDALVAKTAAKLELEQVEYDKMIREHLMDDVMFAKYKPTERAAQIEAYLKEMPLGSAQWWAAFGGQAEAPSQADETTGGAKEDTLPDGRPLPKIE